MKLLLDGSLNQSLQLKDLLSGIFQAEAPGLSVLKFAANKQELGELYFLGGHYIVSAHLSQDDLDGKAAFDKILQLKQAEFVYYACDSGDSLSQQSDNLKIELKGLIDNWQEVVPISEDQLLDKIFNVPTAATSPSKEVEAQIEGVETVPAAANPSEPVVAQTEISVATAPREDVDWDLVEPLVSSGAPGSGTDSSDWTAYKAGTSVHDVRALGRGFQWQRKIRKLFLLILVFLAVCIVVECGIWLLINAPSLHLGTRRYAIPFERRNTHRLQ